MKIKSNLKTYLSITIYFHCYFLAVIVTGGGPRRLGSQQGVELLGFKTTKTRHCTLPDLPVKRYRHTQV